MLGCGMLGCGMLGCGVNLAFTLSTIQCKHHNNNNNYFSLTLLSNPNTNSMRKKIKRKPNIKYQKT